MPNVLRHPEKEKTAAEAIELPKPFENMVQSLRDYAVHNPEAAAFWCLGVGFVLGWKLKPW